MVRNLVRHGDGLALVIDKPILELLKIDADTPLEIATDGKKLDILPVRDEKKRKELMEEFEKFCDKYDRMLTNLAD